VENSSKLVYCLKKTSKNRNLCLNSPFIWVFSLRLFGFPDWLSKNWPLEQFYTQMPNQPKKGKRIVTFQEWETNATALRSLAEQEGITLSELLKRLTQEHLAKHGKAYLPHK